MGRLVVVHHKHHTDEGVYRLVFAEEVEHVRLVEAENPDFDPEQAISEENLPVLVSEEPFVVHANHQSVIWAADDPRWKGKKPAQIAKAQRKIVSDRITELVSERERAEGEAAAAARDLGGAGVEL